MTIACSISYKSREKITHSREAWLTFRYFLLSQPTDLLIRETNMCEHWKKHLEQLNILQHLLLLLVGFWVFSWGKIFQTLKLMTRKVALLWHNVSTFESEVRNSLSELEPCSTDSLGHQNSTIKLSPKIALYIKVLCESKAMLPM